MEWDSEDQWRSLKCVRMDAKKYWYAITCEYIFKWTIYMWGQGIPQNYPEQDNPVSFEKIGVTIYSL